MREIRTITCRQAHRMLHRRLEDALLPADGARLQAHWEACAACVEQAQRLETALRLLQAAPAPEPSPALASRIRAAAAHAQVLRSAPARRLRLAPAWAAAAVAVVVLAALVATRLPGPSAPGTSPAPPVVASTPPSLAPEAPVPLVLAAPPPPVVVAVVAEPAPVRAYRRPARSGPGSVPPPAAPATPAASAPRLAYVHARMDMADTTAARPNTPLREPESRSRVTPMRLAGGSNVSRNSGSFADEVVGGLIADAVLSSYLEGAPEGVHVAPAVLTTGGGS